MSMESKQQALTTIAQLVEASNSETANTNSANAEIRHEKPADKTIQENTGNVPNSMDNETPEENSV